MGGGIQVRCSQRSPLAPLRISDWSTCVRNWFANCHDTAFHGTTPQFPRSDFGGVLRRTSAVCALPVKCDSFRGPNTCPCPVFLFHATIDHAVASFFNNHWLYDFHTICSSAYSTAHDFDHSGTSRLRPDSR